MHTICRISSVDTWHPLFPSITNNHHHHLSLSQLPRLSIIRTFHTMRPLICKSITIARTQDFSPSPSVLCLQPAQRLCCTTMLFLPTKARSWIKRHAQDSSIRLPSLSRTYTDNGIDRINHHQVYLRLLSPLSADDALSHYYFPIPSSPANNNIDKGMFQLKVDPGGKSTQCPVASRQ